MRYFFLSLLAILSMVASADPDVFNGAWKGKGTYILKGDMTQCSEFELVFAANKDTFKFVSGRRVCDKHTEAFYPVTMTYKDGRLYFQGQVVGSYDGNKLEAFYRMPDGNSYRNWRMSMRREGNNLVYEESRTMESESTPLISFAGLVVAQ